MFMPEKHRRAIQKIEKKKRKDASIYCGAARGGSKAVDSFKAVSRK